MKKINSLNNSQGVISLFLGLKSRITPCLPRVYQVLLPMLFVVFGLFVVNENAWGADCTYTQSFNGNNVSGKKNLNMQICSFSAPAPNSVVKVSFHIEFNWVMFGSGYSYDVYAGDTRIGNGSVGNGSSADPEFTLNSTTATSFSIRQTSGNYGANRTVTVSNVVVTYKYAPSLSADDVTMDDTPKGGSSEGTITVNYQNSTNSETLTISEISDENNFFSVSPDSRTVTGCGEGSTTFTVTFAPTSAVAGAQAVYRITGNGETKDVTVTGTSFNVVDPVFTNTIAASYYVDDTALDLADLWKSNNKNGEITYSKVSFTPDIANEAGATAPSVSNDNKLSLGQAGTVIIQMHQAASTGYNEKTAKDTIRINKRSNPMTCSWGAKPWYKEVNFDTHTAVTFTTTNTETGAPAVNVSKVSGGAVADYNTSTKQFDANHREGTVIWEIEQVANYKYVRACEKCTVKVKTVAAPDCEVLLYSSDPDATATSVGQIDLGGVGVKLYFQMKMNFLGAILTLSTSSNGTNWSDQYVSSGATKYSDGQQEITLPENTRYIKFGEGPASSNPYVNDIRVTRTKYFDIENKAGSAITEMTMPLNIHGGVVKRDTFYVDYSTCEGTIKLENHHPRIKFAATNSNKYSFSTGTAHHGRPAIALTYTSPTNDAENITDTIYVYTPSTNKKLIVHAQSKGKLQTTLHYIGNASYTTDAANIAATTLFEVRDENNDLVANPVIMLGTGTSTSVTLANDNKSIASLCGNSDDGTTGNITASYAGDGTYEAATNNGLSQNFTINRLKDEVSFDSGYGSMVVGEEIDLTEWVTSCTSGSDITITSVFKDYIVIEDGKLKAVGKGNGRLRAESAGNCTYNSGVKFLNIAVRNPEDPCESSVLYSSKLIKVGAYSHTSSSPVTYGIPDGPQDKLTFKVWRVPTATQEATLEILDKNDNVLTNGTIEYAASSLPSSEPDAPNKEINMADYPGAKKLRFYGWGTLNKYFSEVRISQKAYLTASTSSVTMSTVKACETAEGQFTVDYSDVSHIQLSQTNNDFTYEVWDGDTKLIGFENGCKSYGTYTVKVFYTPKAKGVYSNTVTISASGKEQVITLNGTANAPEREIVWDLPTGNTITATQSVNLAAYAKTACQNPAGSVTYSYTSAVEGAATIEGSTITFNKAATVTVKASTVASDVYEDATPVEKVWTVGKVGTQMRTLPTITSTITYGDNSSIVTYDNDSWVAEEVLNNNEVKGHINYVGPASFTAVGPQNLTFNFTPDNVATYDVCQFTVPVTVNKLATLNVPVALSFCAGESETFHGETFDTAGEYEVPAVGATRDTLYKVTVTVLQPTTGTDSKTITYGDNESWHGTDLSGYNAGEHEVIYHTTNAVGCDSTVTLSLTVNKATPTLTWTTAPDELAYNATDVVYTAVSTSNEGAISYSITLGSEYAEINATTGALTNIVPGHNITVQATQAVSTNYNAPVAITVNVTIAAVPTNTFTNATGDGDWSNGDNWTSGSKPEEENPNVVVSGQLIIDEDVTVGNLTIQPDGGVTVVTNGTLTINGSSNDQSGYGDLYVKNGGEVNVVGSLKVGDLVVEASIGTESGNAKSGQVAKAEHIVYTNAYIDINMDPNGVMDDTKWYGFTVPFAVDARNGVSRLEGSTIRQCGYGVHYMIAEYDANKRLNTGNGWKYISGNTLNAGQFYFFTVGDGSYNTYRFKALGSTYTHAADASLSVNGDVTNYDANWNGVGNSTLQHVTASYAGGEYVQVFMNGKDAYKTVATNDATFVVGCPFFVQAKVATTLSLDVQNSSTEKYYAPRHIQEKATGVAQISLSATEGGYSDQIYFSAVDKEQDAYIIGQDLAKAGESKVVPQLWMAQYNQKLSVHEAAWNGTRAACQLGIYTPKAGSYELAIDAAPEDATLYLTYNGRAIWNLSMSAYEMDLEQGTTEGYGLRIVASEQTTTDIEQSEISDQSSVRKVMIDDVIYIVTPEGKMYDIVGKGIKF